MPQEGVIGTALNRVWHPADLWLLSLFCFIDEATEAQKLLKATEPLDSSEGLCGSESSPGERALPAWPVPGPAPACLLPWQAASRLPLFCRRWLSRSRRRCPGTRGRLRWPHTGCYLLSSPRPFLARAEVGVRPGVQVRRLCGPLLSL